MDAEFQETPAPRRIGMCRRVAEAGARLVVCHHPHVLQGIERWGDSLIAYGIGNYVTPISDYMRAHADDCHRSVQLEVLVDARGVREAGFLPLVLDGDGLPSRAEGADAEAIRRSVADRSSLLLDELAVVSRYRRMVRDWGRTMSGLLFDAIRRRDATMTRRLVVDVLRTPTKREWTVDLARSFVGLGPRSGD